MQVYKGLDADVVLIKTMSSLLESLGAKNKTILFIIPGGSAAKIAEMVINTLSDAAKSKLSITLTDERFGPVGHRDSNWHVVEQMSGSLQQAQLIPVLEDQLSMGEVASRWAEQLEQAIDLSDEVVALFGIGADSHIAGIKPFSPAVMESNELAIAYTAQDFERITLSPAVFSMITHAYIYTEGENKQEPIDLLSQEKDFHEFPAQLVKQCGSTAVYYKS